jgi:glyoxylase I family protein
MPNISGIAHATFIVSNLQNALAFYQGVLGLALDPDRPDLGFPGAWLNVGSQQIHLMELLNPDPIDNRPEHGGRDRHIALTIDDPDALCITLSNAGISYTHSKSGRAALFCRDPDGNTLEFIQL